MEEKVQSNDLGDQSVTETPVEEVQPKSKKSAEDFERRLVELAEENKKFRKSAAEERRKREAIREHLADQRMSGLRPGALFGVDGGVIFERG